MRREKFEWRDSAGDHGMVIKDNSEVTLSLREHVCTDCTDCTDKEVVHYLPLETVSKLAFHAMRLSSPEFPTAGEFWIVEVDGKRRVVQVQDSPTADTLREDVRFIARIPVEAQ